MRFDAFVGVVLQTMGTDKRMEQNTYEDLMRAWVGKDAYFLFVFDRLIASVSTLIGADTLLIDSKVHHWSILK